MNRRARNHPTWWAFAAHRVSGVVLALFLPVHFLFLASALEGDAALDAALAWTEHPAVVAGELGLVVLLSAHLAGGLRLLAIEFLPWRDGQKTLVALSGGVALACGLAFLLALV
jgi:fumarate reductase subunit D